MCLFAGVSLHTGPATTIHLYAGLVHLHPRMIRLYAIIARPYARMDPIYTFQNTKRTIDVSYTIPAYGPIEARANQEKLSWFNYTQEMTR